MAKFKKYNGKDCLQCEQNYLTNNNYQDCNEMKDLHCSRSNGIQCLECEEGYYCYDGIKRLSCHCDTCNKINGNCKPEIKCNDGYYKYYDNSNDNMN